MSGNTDGDTYICAICKGEFLKTWIDEEALAEMRSYFGEVPEAQRSIVCNDCFRKVQPQ